MSDTKLHIEIDGGVIDVQGDTTLVEKIYNDFKDQLAANDQHAQPSEQTHDTVTTSRRSSDDGEAEIRRREESHPVHPDVAPLVAMTHTPEIERKLVKDLEEASKS